MGKRGVTIREYAWTVVYERGSVRAPMLYKRREHRQKGRCLMLLQMYGNFQE